MKRVSDAGYPQSNIFGVTGGYAFYVRDADGVHFENVTCGYASPDIRPWLAADDATDVTTTGYRTCASSTPSVSPTSGWRTRRIAEPTPRPPQFPARPP